MRPSRGDAEGAFDFGALIARLASHWRAYLVTAILAGAATFGLTFLMPSWYRSVAVLLPPDESDQLSVGLNFQRALLRRPSIAGITDYYSPSDIYKAILSSRSVQQSVIERFNLRSVYHKQSMEKTLAEFRRHAHADLMPDGTISVAVEDHSRDRAAQLANALVDELDRFNVERRNFAAKRTRIFLERRVAETDSLTRISDAALRAYQEKHHVVAPLSIETSNFTPAADILARKMALEVRLAVLRSYLREDNEDVVQVRSELEQLKAQIGTMPGVETELGRLMRDTRLYQQLYSLLSGQLEDARLRESMDTPTVTVLDPAMPSERRARPIRRLWAAGAMVLAVLAAALWTERPRVAAHELHEAAAAS
jgi:hypothetical protein